MRTVGMSKQKTKKKQKRNHRIAPKIVLSTDALIQIGGMILGQFLMEKVKQGKTITIESGNDKDTDKKTGPAA